MSEQEKLARAKQKARSRLVTLFFQAGRSSFLLALLASIIAATLQNSSPTDSVILFAVLFPTLLAIGWLPKVRPLWRSKLVLACQEEGLWDLAEEMLLEDGGEALRQILDGRQPTSSPDNFTLLLASLNVLLIRKGKIRQAFFVTEYLSRLNPDSYAGNLVPLFVVVGKYDKAAGLIDENIEKICSQGRKYSSAYFMELLSKMELNLDLRQVSHCEETLSLIKDCNDHFNAKMTSTVDRILQDAPGKKEIEQAFYWKAFGRTCLLREHFADAEIALKTAQDIMSNRELQQKVTLFYPELLIDRAGGFAEQTRFAEAEQLFSEAITYYDTCTIYRGSMYWLATSWLAVCQMKQDKPYSPEAPQTALTYLESEVDPIHPKIVLVLTHLAACRTKEGEEKLAAAALQRALSISRQLFPKDDQQTQALEDMLQAPLAPTMN